MQAAEQLLGARVVGGLYQPLRGEDIKARGAVLDGDTSSREDCVRTDRYEHEELDELLAAALDAAREAAAEAAGGRARGAARDAAPTEAAASTRRSAAASAERRGAAHARVRGAAARAPRRRAAARPPSSARPWRAAASRSCCPPRRAAARPPCSSSASCAAVLRGRRRAGRRARDHVHRPRRGRAARARARAPAGARRARRGARHRGRVRRHVPRLLRAGAARRIRCRPGLDPDFRVLDEAASARLRRSAFESRARRIRGTASGAPWTCSPPTASISCAPRSRRSTRSCAAAASCRRGCRCASHAVAGGGRALRTVALYDDLLARFGERYERLKQQHAAVDFDDLELLAGALLGENDAAARLVGGALRAADGRRVPGHEPAPARDPARARPREPVHRRRRAAGDLRLPPRRRAPVPRAARAARRGRRARSRCAATSAAAPR